MLYSLQFNLFHIGIHAATTEETSVEMSKSINEFSTEKNKWRTKAGHL